MSALEMTQVTVQNDAGRCLRGVSFELLRYVISDDDVCHLKSQFLTIAFPSGVSTDSGWN